MSHICTKCAKRYKSEGLDPDKQYKCKECQGQLIYLDPAKHKKFGRYELVEILGKGGMGEVWKAWQSDLRRWVAIKLLTGESEEDIARFTREARIAAKLSHPNIGQIYEVGKAGNHYFIALQYIEGHTLDEYPGKNLNELLKIIKYAAVAVHFAHKQGIIHRDIKPANIIIGKPPMEETSVQTYVLDFGLARSTKRQDRSLSVSGMLMGTPAYMSPEQAEGHVHVDARSDVYSLGATLYEVVTGQAPFTGKTLVSIVTDVVNEEPTPVRKINPRIPAEVELIIAKAMSKDKNMRYTNAYGLAKDIERFLAGDPIQAKSSGIIYKLKKKIRKRPLVSAALTAVVLVIVTSIILITTQASKSAEEQRQAGEEQTFLRDQAKRDRAKAEAKAATLKEQTAQEKLAMEKLNTLWLNIILAKTEFYKSGGNLERMQARLTENIEAVTSFIKDNPKVAQGYYIRARGKMYFMDYKGAKVDILKATKIDPDFTPAYMLLARIYLEQYVKKLYGINTMYTAGKTEDLLKQAAAVLAKAARKGSGKSGFQKIEEDIVNEVLLKALTTYYLNKNSVSARKIIEEALVEIKSEEYYNWLGFFIYIAAADRPDYQKAIEYQNKALKRMPYYAKAYMDRALAHFRLDDYQAVIDDCNQAIKINPNYIEAYISRGIARDAINDYHGAIKDYDEAIRLDPDNIMAYINRAKAKTTLHDYPGAIEDNNRVLKINPKDYLAYHGRGYTKQQQGDYQGALKDYNQAIKLNSINPGALCNTYLNRSLVWKQLGDRQKAMNDLNQLIKLSPNYNSAYYLRALLKKDINDFQGAIADFNQAIRIDPKDTDAYISRGVVYYELKQIHQAIADWTKAIELDPSRKQKLEAYIEEARQEMPGK